MIKTIVLSLFAVLFSVAVFAQLPYPSPPVDRSNIVYMEYFIDNDPGLGKGNMVALPAATELTSFNVNVNIDNISKAWHKLYVRTLNTNGEWSLTNYAIFNTFELPPYPDASQAPADIIEIEYFIDTDPGMGNGIKLPLTTAVEHNQITVPIDLRTIENGIHKFVVRTKNSNGKWSLSHMSIFENTGLIPYPDAPAAAGAITQMEYFFDTDPGYGNGKTINFAGAPDILQLSVDVELAGLSEGAHTLYIRSKEFPWSFTMAVNFSIEATLPVSWLYVRGERKQQHAIISWATAQEWDTDKFIVEYSRDGREYKAIGEVTAAGNSATRRTYSFNWNGLEHGTNYFRLKQLDKNGNFSYSSIIALPYTDKNSAPVLMPNPVDKIASLLIPPSIEAKQIFVFDASGKTVWQQTIADRNSTSQMLQFGHLQKGIYILKIQGKNETYSIRFVKN